MTIEMWSIAAMALIMLPVTMAQGGSVARVQGAWELGSRDKVRKKTALHGRYSRVVQNQTESTLVYAPLMALVIALDKTTSLTEIAA